MKLPRRLTILGIAMVLITIMGATLVEAYSPMSPPASCSQPPGTTTTATSTSDNNGSDTNHSNSTVTATATVDSNVSNNNNNSNDNETNSSDNGNNGSSDTGYSYHANSTGNVSYSYNYGKHSSPSKPSSPSKHSSPSKSGSPKTTGTSGTTSTTTSTPVTPTSTKATSATPTDTTTTTQGNPCPTPTSTTTTTTANDTFKGIYEFSGKNSSADANNAALSGTSLNYYWSKIEPQKGTLNWNLIDQDMKPWITQGKKVLLRISAGGQTMWDPAGNSGNATPQWVYDEGVMHFNEADQSVIPAYWSPVFQQEWNAFVQAFAARYDGNANITAVEISVGEGGETKADTSKADPNLFSDLQKIGYSDQGWLTTIKNIIGFYTASFHKTPLVLMPDSSFLDKTSHLGETQVVDYAVSQNLWLQDNGMGANRTLTSSWHQQPLIEEQRLRTSQSGDTLQQDLQSGLDLGATYTMVFASDIDNPANQAVLQQVASRVNGNTTTTSSTSTPSNTPVASSSPVTTGTTTASGPNSPSMPGNPALTIKSEQIATDAQSCDSGCVDNGWGTHKSRIIRLSTGDIYTVYTDKNSLFHVMHRNMQGLWSNAFQGDAGMEPINILRGPGDQINVFARPVVGPHDNLTSSTIVYYKSTDGMHFSSSSIPGDWNTAEQGYAGAGIDSKGDMVVGIGPHDNVPGYINFSYYSVATNTWTAHKLNLDVRYAYDFFFPEDDGSLTITGTRDYVPSELPNNGLPGGGAGIDYAFDKIGYYYIPNMNTAPASITGNMLDVASADAKGNQVTGFVNFVDQSDAYMDTQGVLHVLYYKIFDGAYEALVQNGKVTKNVPIHITSEVDSNGQGQNNKMRITQDTQSHFYITNMTPDGKFEIYPGTAQDTDGTQLGSPIALSTTIAGCNDHDNCLSPTFTVPRSGNAISDTVDGIYGNFGKVIYFQLKLR